MFIIKNLTTHSVRKDMEQQKVSILLLTGMHNSITTLENRLAIVKNLNTLTVWLSHFLPSMYLGFIHKCSQILYTNTCNILKLRLIKYLSSGEWINSGISIQLNMFSWIKTVKYWYMQDSDLKIIILIKSR